MRRRQRGGVMVISLAVLAGLVGILAAAASNQRVALKAQLNRMERQRARMAAETGIQHALATLVNHDKALVGAGDEWELLGGHGDQEHTIGDVSYRLQIVDASSMININSATEEQLQRLPLTTEQIDSLLDWRSADRNARPEGAKDEYYNSLDVPYNAKLRPFDSTDELLLVKGFTARALYEPQTDIVNPNTIVTGSPEDQPALAEIATAESVSQAPEGRINVRNASLAQLVQLGMSQAVATQVFAGRQGFQNLGQILRLGGVSANDARIIIDSIAVPPIQQRLPGRINLNTATEPVLNSIPNMTPDLAAAIVTRQATPFQSVGELATLPGATVAFLADAAALFSVNSQSFLVRVVGRAGATSVALIAVVNTEGDAPRIVSISEAPFDDMPIRWGWSEQPVSQVALSEGL